MTNKPATTIRLGEKLYNLAALVYTNASGTHFFANIFLSGRPIFYDGMKSPVLRWQTIDTYRTSKHPITHIVYMRTKRECDDISERVVNASILIHRHYHRHCLPLIISSSTASGMHVVVKRAVQ